MPTYDYRCKVCGHEFELFQGITEDKLRKCPECSKMSLERLIGAGAGIIFKGNGFYVTDYGRRNSKDSTGATEGENTESEGGEGQSSSDSSEKSD